MTAKHVRLVVALIVGAATVAQLSAKGDPVRIAIEGGGLVSPVEIADPHILNRFIVWGGLGTSEVEGFIIDWGSGPATDKPVGLQRYKVSFYSMSPDRGNERRSPGVEYLSYTVFYEYDATSQRGFVYLPGKNDPEWANNVASIHRGVEGNWLQATAAWDQAVNPLLAQAARVPAVQ
jgi:hypothetical protein